MSYFLPLIHTICDPKIIKNLFMAVHCIHSLFLNHVQAFTMAYIFIHIYMYSCWICCEQVALLQSSKNLLVNLTEISQLSKNSKNRVELIDAASFILLLICRIFLAARRGRGIQVAQELSLKKNQKQKKKLKLFETMKACHKP